MVFNNKNNNMMMEKSASHPQERFQQMNAAAAPQASQAQTGADATAGRETDGRRANAGVGYMPLGREQHEDIYEYFTQFLLPAIFASIPILAGRICQDVYYFLSTASQRFTTFVLPSFMTSSSSSSQISSIDAAAALHELAETLPASFKRLWENMMNSSSHSAIAETMLNHFDTNGDGHISSSELLNLTEFLKKVSPPDGLLHVQVLRAPTTWWAWFAREWPLMDWKLGVFLGRTFGGILFLLAVSSIVPGSLHGWTARLLRWPILALTYFLMGVELVVYCVIRLFIRLAEHMIARPKHSKLRRQMQNAKSYEEWYQYANELDRSQKRHVWLRQEDDELTRTGVRYNWSFIRQLQKDMHAARRRGDEVLALAALENCTRKNVGGIMSEDLFSYSNSGEPKTIVSDFLKEVVTTLHWVTHEAAKIPLATNGGVAGGVNNNNNNASSGDGGCSSSYTVNMQEEVRKEKDKLWKSLVELFDPSLRHLSRSNSSTASLSGSVHSGMDTTQSSHDRDDSDGDDRPMELPSVHREQVLFFLKRARAAYGRTALCLSGGAMMGLYHFGHVLGLIEAGILPNIISGTSAGSIIAAIVCTRTDEELKEVLTPEVIIKRMTCFARPWKDRIKSVWQNGNMFDFDEWNKLIKWFTNGDMTFEEAYHKTGRVFCITLSSTTKKAPPVLLNYLSAPRVTIASAVLASAAVPGFIPPVSLQFKDKKGRVRGYSGDGNGDDKGKDQTYFDGSIRQDIPINGLSECLNCQFFIACQCNPHIVPFFFNAKGGVGRPSRWSSGTQEHSWRGGFLLAALEMYLKNHMKAKHKFLHEVEASVGFTSTMMIQDFEGSTTIVPQAAFQDYFKLFSDPSLSDLHRYFQNGRVAAYEHTQMIRLHYSITDALDECIAELETSKRSFIKKRPNFKGSGAAREAPVANLKALQVDKMADGNDGSCTKKMTTGSDSGLLSSGTASTDEDDEHVWIDL